MIHWAWIIAGFVFGAWYGMLLVLLTTTKKQKANNSAPSQSGVFESDASCEDKVSQQEEIVNTKDAD